MWDGCRDPWSEGTLKLLCARPPGRRTAEITGRTGACSRYSNARPASAGQVSDRPASARPMAVGWWDPGVLSVLPAPTWLVCAVPGAVLMLLGRKKKALIGYAR